MGRVTVKGSKKHPHGGSTGGGPTDTSPASISVSPLTATLQIGSTDPLTANVYNAAGQLITASVTWESLNTSVCTVDASTGVATAVAAGSAAIRAKIGSLISFNSVGITVTALPATKYLVTASDLTPEAGSQIDISAQLANSLNAAIATAGVTVTATKTGAGGSFVSNTAVTDSAGIARFQFTVAADDTINHTVSVSDSAGRVGTSATIDVGAVPEDPPSPDAEPSIFDGGRLQAWNGSIPSDANTIPSGAMLADFTPTQTGAFDASGNQLFDWDGTVYYDGTPTFFVLMSPDNSVRAIVPINSGAGSITLLDTSWNRGDKLVLSSGAISGLTFTGVCTVGATRLGHESELPRLNVNVAMGSAPSGATVTVAPGDNAQAKYDSTGPNDILAFQANQTFNLSAPLVLSSGHAKWITTTGTTPAFGVRHTSWLAVTHMSPRVVAPSGQPAIRFNNSMSDVRVFGLDVTSTTTDQSDTINPLIEMGVDGATLSTYPRKLIVDRCWVHGQETAWRRIGVSMQGSHLAVISSTIDEIHYKTFGDAGESNSDSSAVAIYGGPGPFLVDNSTMIASHECFVVGSTLENVNYQLPADLTFTNNYLTRPMSWKGTYGPPASGHTCKNVFEIKKMRRALVENNIFEHAWVDNQSGGGMLLYPASNSNGLQGWSNVCDITIRKNWIRRVAIGIILDSTYSNERGEYQGTSAIRFHIAHNAFTQIGTTLSANPVTGGDFNFVFQINNSFGDPAKHIKEITIEHNSFANSDNDSGYAYPSLIQIASDVRRNFIFRSNTTIAPYANPSVAANAHVLLTPVYADGAAWTAIKGEGCSWDHNAFCTPSLAPSVLPEPGTNNYTTDGGAIAFVNLARFYNASAVADLGGLALGSTSLYKNAAHDGTDPGANITELVSVLTPVLAAATP